MDRVPQIQSGDVIHGRAGVDFGIGMNPEFLKEGEAVALLKRRIKELSAAKESRDATR